MARILVIDDDEQIRGVVRRILERAGHEVQDIADGEAGVRLYRDHPADLVITDIFMPPPDGLQTIRRLRREFPEVKIIALSGGDRSGTLDLRDRAEVLGASRTLRKPFEMSDLLKVVHELLEKPGPAV